MAEKTSTEAAVESVVMPLGERPGTEVANELAFVEGDMHNDPDSPNPLPTVTEATEAVSEWRVAKCLLKLRNQVNALAPNRKKASDGTIGDHAHCGSPSSASDHCARIIDAGVGVVAAIDITHDPDGGCDANSIASSIHADRESRVKYIIWNKRIANSSAVHGTPAWTWRAYTGSNPHTRHIHISVKPTKADYDSETAWSVSVSGAPPSA